MTTVAFPGLGIKEFTLDPVAFELFGREVRWYGIFITLGILSAFCYALYRAKKNEGIKIDDVFDYAIFLVLAGVIGARLYYVVFEFDQIRGETLGQTLYNIIAIWEGGLGIYGGIIAGAAALFLVSKAKRIPIGRAFDMVSPGVMLAQAIGRWGNFMNGEAYGWSENVASSPFRMYLEGAYHTEIIGGMKVNVAVDYVHPTFLYESAWNLVGFVLINLFYKRKKFDGQVCFLYLSWYGFGRMFIEGLRTDSLYLGPFRISQVVGFVCFIGGALCAFGIPYLSRRLAAVGSAPADLATLGDGEPSADEDEPASDIENDSVSKEEPLTELPQNSDTDEN